MKNYQFINDPQIQADYFRQQIIFINELCDFFCQRITRIKRIIFVNELIWVNELNKLFEFI